jgi:ABC-type phosphate transport system substrate-binding protein
LSDDELIAEGWDPASVENRDGDPSTRKWSELSGICADEEIIIAGPAIDSAAALLFEELVFGESSDETFDTARPGSFFSPANNSELSSFLASNDTAIAFFDVGYLLMEIDLEALALVSVMVLGEDGEEDTLFKPVPAALEDSSYPLSLVVHFLIHNDEESLEKTRGFVEHAFSEAGDLVTRAQGFFPLADAAKLLVTTRIQSESGIPKEVIESYCGPEGGTISIAGSSTVFPVADGWAKIYSSFCDVTIVVEGGGSSSGASRVCGVEGSDTAVDIGDMSREWKDDEAQVLNEFLYDCVESEEERSVIQVDVAIDGLTVAMAHAGPAVECIQILGGLSTDQLRWIFSNYNDKQLEETGWDAGSLKNSDSNSQTHKWR